MEPRVEVVSDEKSLERKIRAFHWMRLLAEVPDRSAGGEGEREAAQRVELWLRDLGFQEVAPRSAAAGPAPGAVVALHAGVAALGCALGGPTGFALTALAAASFRRERCGGAPLLSRALPARDSLYVCARAGAARARRRVVLCAPLDAPRAGRWLRSPWLRRRLGPFCAERVGSPAGLDGWLWRALLAAAVVSFATALGADAALARLAQGALGLGLAAAAAAGFEWSRAPASPGAGAHASALAALLTCGEQLLAQLRSDEELWVVAAGAHESGGGGLRAFLDEQGESFARSAVFVHFERLGGSVLSRVRAEVGLERRAHPPQLVELARRVAASGAYGEVACVDHAGATGAATGAARDLAVLALVAFDADGQPRQDGLATDLASSVDAETPVRAADFAAAVVEASLRGDADPLALI